MKKYRLNLIVFCLFASILAPHGNCEEANILAFWTFDEKVGESVHDKVTGTGDPISGNFRVVEGVSGKAIKFDGYTTVITRNAEGAPALSGAFTIEAWVAIAAFPWNWCPVVSHTGNSAGYFCQLSKCTKNHSSKNTIWYRSGRQSISKRNSCPPIHIQDA